MWIMIHGMTFIEMIYIYAQLCIIKHSNVIIACNNSTDVKICPALICISTPMAVTHYWVDLLHK